MNHPGISLRDDGTERTKVGDMVKDESLRRTALHKANKIFVLKGTTWTRKMGGPSE